MNFTRTNYNIINPYQNEPKLQNLFSTQRPNKNPVAAIRQGKCHQVYGISDFDHNNRSGALKYHEKFQVAFGKDSTTFNRTNGEFTKFTD